MPLIFADSGWDKLNNTIISTSNCGNPSLRHFGFGPTSGDGFGIGYIIKDEGISICASSKHRQTKRFVDALESYLLEIRRILRATQRRGTSPKASRAREASRVRPKPGSRVKSRGRVIKALEPGKKSPGTMTPVQDESGAGSDDEGLGGCKFEPVLISDVTVSSFDDLFVPVSSRPPTPDSSDGSEHERVRIPVPIHGKERGRRGRSRGVGGGGEGREVKMKRFGLSIIQMGSSMQACFSRL
jgi:hypothetical protein